MGLDWLPGYAIVSSSSSSSGYHTDAINGESSSKFNFAFICCDYPRHAILITLVDSVVAGMATSMQTSYTSVWKVFLV